MRHSTVLLTVSVLIAGSMLPNMASAQTETLSVIAGGQNVGHVNVDTTGGRTTSTSTSRTTDAGRRWPRRSRSAPTACRRRGRSRAPPRSAAKWTSASDRGKRARPGLIHRRGQPTSRSQHLRCAEAAARGRLSLYARALLKQPGTQMRALPGGTLQLEKGDNLTCQGTADRSRSRATSCRVDLHPDTMLLDAAGNLFASVTPTVVVVREGYEGEESAGCASSPPTGVTERFAAIQREVAHRYGAPMRIRNVRCSIPRPARSPRPSACLSTAEQIAARRARR